MKQLAKIALLLLSGIFMLSACNCKLRKAQDLNGLWSVSFMDGRSMGASNDKLTLQINTQAAQAGGIGICNRYSCDLDTSRIKDGKIGFANVISTRVGCDGNGLESMLFSRLSGVTEYTIKGNKLILTGKDSGGNKVRLDLVRKPLEVKTK